MTHPEQLTEAGISEKYLRKIAKKDGVPYKRLVQIAMEEWGKLYLKQINKMLGDHIKGK